MPRLERPDGVEIHWEEEGEGPLVVLSGYWSLHPSVFVPIIEELRRDHRVVRYDDRGTGASTHAGPYDLETASGDLEAVVEAAGGSAVIIGVADGTQRAVKVGAHRPDLVEGVVGLGVPMGRQAFAGADALASSEPVVEALLEMAATDYRSALRTVVTSTNPQMSEDELRERVRAQAEHVPAEAGAARLRAWAGSDATEGGRAMGDRLWILHSPRLGGGWFPSGPELVKAITGILPDAHVEEVEDGFVSRPDATAAVVRRITARARTPAS
jgi:pimeloyl-ACP methyl ester carboxylesterase